MGFIRLDLYFEKPVLPKSDQFVLSKYRKNTIYVINHCIFAYELFAHFCFFCFILDILTDVDSKNYSKFGFRCKICIVLIVKNFTNFSENEIRFSVKFLAINFIFYIKILFLFKNIIIYLITVFWYWFLLKQLKSALFENFFIAILYTLSYNL